MLKANSVDGPEGISEGRLDSWKAIAAYLGRDVSTVRRWEKTEGLPVHRHRHAARGSAYAYKPELDRWFDGRRADLEVRQDKSAMTGDDAAGRRDEEPAVVQSSTPVVTAAHGRLRVTWFATAAILAVAAAAVLVYTRGRSSAVATGFHARDWILVGDIENRTGDSRLDDTVQYALERELSESLFVNVVSRERVGDTLRLMKRPLDTRIDRPTGLEVCLRDGGIRALLTGRVEKLGGTYVVSALVVDPNESGRTIAAAEARALDDGKILDAVHQLSGQLRRALGEESRSVQSASLRLERVTTSSLQALKLYTEGVRAVNRRQWRVGAELLQRAVGEDPNFAAAHIYLAYCLSNVGRPADEYLLHAREAARLAEHQNDREQYFILASYHRMIGEREKAVGLYEALLKLYPDHFWGANNLFNLYSESDRHGEQWPLMERLLKARPNDFITTVRAIHAALGAGIDLRQVDTMTAHARQLSRDDLPVENPWELVFLDLLPAAEAWFRDDVRETRRLVELVGHRSPGHAKVGAMIELALGRIADAEKLVAVEDNAGDREGDQALLAFFRGDRRSLAAHTAAAQRDYGRQLTLVVWLSMQAGPVEDAERFFSDWSARPDDGHSPTSDSAWANTVRAELRLRRGDSAAVVELENAMRGVDPARARYLREAEALADALGAQGDFAKGVAVLEEATRTKTRVFSGAFGEPFGGVFWLRLRSKLAGVYRQMGRAEEADRIDAEVSMLLAQADADFKLFP